MYNHLMAKRRGWQGAPPENDEDARTRIVEEASRSVDRLGVGGFTLSEVANELGISRPTVYRYFPSSDELLSAVGQYVMADFSDRLRAHLSQFTDPAEWIVEGIATPIEWIPLRPQLMLLLAAGRSQPFASGFTSSIAVEMTREAIRLAPVDWADAGLSHNEMDELVELMLRLIASMLIDPPHPARTGASLRTYLRRWIAPALAGVGHDASFR